jgi:3-deoxy-7-phosphoheptulonate synthase
MIVKGASLTTEDPKYGFADRGFEHARAFQNRVAEWVHEGNEQVILCERGVRSFDSHTRNLLDLTSIPVVQSLSHLPIIADPSHGTGLRSKVTPMARAAVAAGADGLIVEVHQDPTHAMSDGAQSLYPEQFEELMGQIRVIAKAIDRDLVPPLREPAPARA